MGDRGGPGLTAAPGEWAAGEKVRSSAPRLRGLGRGRHLLPERLALRWEGTARGRPWSRSPTLSRPRTAGSPSLSAPAAWEGVAGAWEGGQAGGRLLLNLLAP